MAKYPITQSFIRGILFMSQSTYLFKNNRTLFAQRLEDQGGGCIVVGNVHIYWHTLSGFFQRLFHSCPCWGKGGGLLWKKSKVQVFIGEGDVPGLQSKVNSSRNNTPALHIWTSPWKSWNLRLGQHPLPK